MAGGVIWHVEHKIGQLGSLTDAPIQDCKSRVLVDIVRIELHVFDGNVKVGGRILVGILSIYESIAVEIWPAIS